MKVILAQGNPGTNYQASRHNVGFQVVDSLARAHAVEFSTKPKFFAAVAELSVEGEKVLLVKPTTYYNETGRCARALVDFYKLDPAHDFLVVHDDVALPLGTVRVRERGSSAGNNGIKSLSAHLGESYMRIRVGINTELRTRMGDDASFVLAPFTKADQTRLTEAIIPHTLALLRDFCAGNSTSTSYKDL